MRNTETLEVIAQGTVKTDGEINDGETTARIREDKAQKIAEEKAALENWPEF